MALGGTVIELKDGKKVQLSKLNEEQKITLDGVKLVQYKVIEDAAVHEQRVDLLSLRRGDVGRGSCVNSTVQ